MKTGRNFQHIHTIQAKIMMVCLMLAVGITLASLILSYYTEVDSYRKISENYLTQYIEFADQNFDSMINEARKISISISFSSEILQPALTSTASEASYDRFVQKRKMSNFLSGLMTQKEYIEDILMVTSAGDIYQASSELMVKKDLNETDISTALEAGRPCITYDNGKKSVLYSWPVYDKNEIKATGIIKLNYEVLINAYEMEPLRNSTVVIQQQNDTVFYCNRGDGKKAAEILGEVKKREKNTGYIQMDGERQYYIRNESDTGMMSVTVLIPYHVLSKDAENLKYKFILIGFGAVMAAVVCSVLLSRRLCGNLKILSHGMEKIRQGNLDTRVEVQTQDEIGVVADTFNRMMDQIARLMREIREKEKLKKEAEQKFLDAQIEPHFLYNSINSISYVAHMRGEAEIERVSSALSELFRSVLSNKREFISLWEEKEYIDNYILIERFKYTREFDLSWDVEEELWAYQIPKLLLQPIVENALIHGIADKPGGKIHIKAYSDRDAVTIKIMDNGKGIAQEKLLKLQGNIRKKTGFRRVGMANVFERIHLIFGEKYGGCIYSYQDAFTCVELKLPVYTEPYL